MGKFGNNPNKGFLKELASNPKLAASAKKSFDYKKPIVKPELETGSTLRRLQEKKSVAPAKSNIIKETLSRQVELRKKHSK